MCCCCLLERAQMLLLLLNTRPARHGTPSGLTVSCPWGSVDTWHGELSTVSEEGPVSSSALLLAAL